MMLGEISSNLITKTEEHFVIQLITNIQISNVKFNLFLDDLSKVALHRTHIPRDDFEIITE